MSNQARPMTPNELQAHLDSLPDNSRVDLRDMQIASLRGVTFPNNITHLNLSNNRIDSLVEVRFPDSLRVLMLDHNQIHSLDEARFPDSLRVLALEHNNIASLDGVVFPRDLVILHLQSNPIGRDEITRVVPPYVQLTAEADDHILETMNPVQFANRLSRLSNRHESRAHVEPPSAVRIARTYREYVDMCLTADNTTVVECNEALCFVCRDPYVEDGRLLRPVMFHATHKSDGSVMWTHPSHIAEIKGYALHQRSSNYTCPMCRCKLDITLEQLHKNSTSTLQKVARGHKSRKEVRTMKFSRARMATSKRPQSWTKSRTSASSRNSRNSRNSRKSRRSADF
jgi:hypothetical protein